MKTKILYLVSHPIQYQAPMLRLIAGQAGISLRVIFETDTSHGYFDQGFRCSVQWDVPLRQGYDSAVAAQVDIAQEIRAADYVWCHGWQSGWMRKALIQAHRCGKPVLMRGENTLHAMPDGMGLRGWAKRLYLRWVFSHVSGFLAIGSDNRDYYLQHGIAAERIFHMPYAIDNEAFAKAAASADTASLRHSLGIAEGQPVILFAGKLMKRKHPHTLLQAWRQAPWPDKPPALVFVGDGEMVDELRNSATEDVFFAGFRNQGELPAFYTLADIFVLAAEAEPWGLAVNEAMACGTAVIVGDHVGCAADLVSPQIGMTVRPGDVPALAQALVELLPRAKQAGQAARKRMENWSFQDDLLGLCQAIYHLEQRPCV